MLEFEFNTPVETDTLVEFFARCGWEADEAGAKVEWALAASDQWVLCKLDGEVIGFGRSCRFGPVKRVVFDVLVDSRFRGRGLRAEIVRLLSQGAGRLEEVSVFSDGRESPFEVAVIGEVGSPLLDFPLVSPDIYLGRRHSGHGGGQ